MSKARLAVENYPALRELLWDRPGLREVDENEAFYLYETRWLYIDRNRLTAAERKLIERLTQIYGGGVMNVPT